MEQGGQVWESSGPSQVWGLGVSGLMGVGRQSDVKQEGTRFGLSCNPQPLETWGSISPL